MKVSLLLLALASVAYADPATTAQLTAFVKTKGKKLGSAKTSTLESPDFVNISVKKGYCYTVEIKLAAGASWKSDTSPTMLFPEWLQNPLSVGATLIGDTGAVFEPPCSQKSGKVSFGLRTYGPDDHVGSGGYTLQVYERKPTARDLADQAKAKKAHADSLRERDASRAKTCSGCASPVGGRRVCLERRGLTMSDCGW